MKEEEKVRKLLPGLALSCQQPESQFISWERREKKGILKAMFSWKQHPNKTEKIANRKEEREIRKEQSERKGDKNKSKNKSSSKSTTMKGNCQEKIDHSVYRILTKRTGRRSKKAPEKVCCQTEGWRGKREEPSEISVQRKTPKRKNQVHTFIHQGFRFTNLFLLMLAK